MGSNGDRAGGVGRPENMIVALGRANGPLSSKTPPIYSQWAPADRDGQASKIYAPKVDPDHPDKDGTMTDLRRLIEVPVANPNLPQLYSLADYFDPHADPAIRPSAQVALGQLIEGRAADADAVTKQVREVLKVFFSANAKILGVVTFAELLE